MLHIIVFASFKHCLRWWQFSPENIHRAYLSGILDIIFHSAVSQVVKFSVSRITNFV